MPALESALRGAIYDPYVRRMYWEGLGPDQNSGRWGSEADSWLSCPAPPSSQSAWQDQPPQEVLAAAAPRKPKAQPGGGPPLTSDSDTLCPYAWGAPIHHLNCDVVWPPQLDNPEFASFNEEEEGEEEHCTACGRVTAPRRKYLELDTPQYSGRIERDWVVEKLLMQAGVRLAGILNVIFAPQQQ